MVLSCQQSQRGQKVKTQTCVMGAIICYNQTPLIPRSRNIGNHRIMVWILCAAAATAAACVLLKHPFIRAPRQYITLSWESCTERERERIGIITEVIWCKERDPLRLIVRGGGGEDGEGTKHALAIEQLIFLSFLPAELKQASK